MGGTVHLADGNDEGATFVVRLPLARCDAPATAGPGAEPAPLAGPSLAGLRVLVAEDNTLVRELLVAFLTENGADVIVAVDGATALSLAREGVADVMLLDIGLPQLDGLAVAETLRAEGMRTLRIIGLSAHVSAADEARARRAGMDAFLGKPVRLATLAAVITQEVRDPRVAEENPERIADSALRQKLATQFASETPALLAGMRTALAAGDWLRLRSRAHYLKNSADVLGLRGLQDACARLAGLDEPPDAVAAHRLLDEIEAAIPAYLVASSDLAPAARAWD
jgi:CheY-like chemotaxis protein